MEILTKPIRELKGWDRNPRQISPEALAGLKASIEAFGLVQPIIWNKQTDRVVGGHQRLLVLKSKGVLETEVVVVDLPEDKEKALNVALNNPEISGTFTSDLPDMLAEIKAENEKLYDSLLLDALNATIKVEDPEVQEDGDAPEPPVDPITKSGDIWELGEHRLICGDCGDPEVAIRIFGEDRWDLMITDPPYGVSYASKNEYLNSISPGNRRNRIQTEIENDHKTAAEMSDFWKATLGVARTMGKDTGSYYITGPQGGDLLLLLQAIGQSGFKLKHMLIWVKNQRVFGRSDYHYKHEPIIFGWNDTHHFYGPSNEVSVWEIDRPRKSDLHPAMKPIELYARSMRNSSKCGDIVFDPFAGSGPIFIAAEQAKRIALGIELSPAYCDVIVNRWEKLTGKKAVRREHG
jgi:DNA modification methylase